MRPDWIVIGLGNPGPRYKNTPHNAGFSVLDQTVDQFRLHWRKDSSKQPFASALFESGCPGMSGVSQSLLVKPLTYMNQSGLILPTLRKRYGLDPKQVVIVLDNLDLPPGKIRLKTGGGSSSHNGIRSLQANGLGREVLRLFVGIGHPGSPELVSQYVLSPPSPADSEAYQAGLERAREALCQILSGNSFESVANEYNRERP